MLFRSLWYPLPKTMGTKVFQNYIGLHRSKHLAISMVFSHYRYPTQVSFYPLRIQRCLKRQFMLVAPFTGMLTRLIAIRKVQLIGTVGSSLGIGLCYFATESLHVTLLFGALGGKQSSLYDFQGSHRLYRMSSLIYIMYIYSWTCYRLVG